MPDPSTTAPAAPATPATPATPHPLFTTARLQIRPLIPSDAPSMSHHANNPRVSQHMSNTFPSPYTLDSATGWIAMNQTPPIYNWGICLSSAPAEVIGGCGLKPGADVQACGVEIGFWIGEEHWGKGYTTELLNGVVEFVFGSEEGRELSGQEKGWTRVWGWVFEGNVGSRRCFEKGGFRHEGTMRGAAVKKGVSIDLLVFGLVREEWEERRKGV
ncbi:hypothetical protein E8E13_002750 [Curvularia kusanoi]|uniref:N-acetyltransferase domain-containing protein n=1 Tax=Curvularia kusanoi TaxID=90978 RepID=A0A9P4TH48_CURKU|nr:hypothetical protein E8E13_002750 [Curvularia kusanoi]